MTTRATPTARTPLRLPLHPLAPLGEPLNAAQKDRYARHLNLPGVGEDGQRRLSAARVLVIGAGGLGSPVLLYLAAAGVGTIGIVDDDVVDSSNLQRQVIHSTAAVGKRKVDTAAERMQGINPDLIVKKFPLRLHPADIDTYRTQFGSQWDLIVDATDNFASRYLVNDLATALGIPEVMGSVFHWQGQVASFWAQCPDPQRAVTLRDLYPQEPSPEAPSREPGAGIMGALCCTIGGLMATEVVKLLLGEGNNLLGRVLYYNAMEMRIHEVTLHSDTTTQSPHTSETR